VHASGGMTERKAASAPFYSQSLYDAQFRLRIMRLWSHGSGTNPKFSRDTIPASAGQRTDSTPVSLWLISGNEPAYHEVPALSRSVLMGHTLR
jgi:hypothetical protein